MSTATLWYVEYCDSNLGVWSKSWFVSQEQALQFHAKKVEDGFDPNSEAIGEKGDLLAPESVEVELTPEGVCRALNQYGGDL